MCHVKILQTIINVNGFHLKWSWVLKLRKNNWTQILYPTIPHKMNEIFVFHSYEGYIIQWLCLTLTGGKICLSITTLFTITDGFLDDHIHVTQPFLLYNKSISLTFYPLFWFTKLLQSISTCHVHATRILYTVH